jgi:hypothetical protein
MERVTKDEGAITNLKNKSMEENKRRNEVNEHTREQGSSLDRSIEESKNETVRENVGQQKGSADLGGATSMDEKSSGLGRRDKGTGLSTKDGLTGSDYDGQLTE